MAICCCEFNREKIYVSNIVVSVKQSSAHFWFEDYSKYVEFIKGENAWLFYFSPCQSETYLNTSNSYIPYTDCSEHLLQRRMQRAHTMVQVLIWEGRMQSQTSLLEIIEKLSRNREKLLNAVSDANRMSHILRKTNVPDSFLLFICEYFCSSPAFHHEFSMCECKLVGDIATSTHVHPLT